MRASIRRDRVPGQRGAARRSSGSHDTGSQVAPNLADEFELASTMARNPASHRIRVIEHVEFATDSYRRTVTTEFLFTDEELNADRSVRLLPLIFRTREQVFENLAITDSSDKILPRLSRSEAEELAGALIEQVWNEVLADGRRRDKTRMERCTPRSLNLALRKLQTIVSVPFNEAQLQHEAVVNYLKVNRVFELMQPATQFARLFIKSYIVWVVLPDDSGNRPTVRFSHDVIYDRYSRKKLRWLRWVLGYVPTRYVLYTNLAARSETYHFQMSLPEGWHVVRQKLSRNGQILDERKTPWPYAHLYDRTPPTLGLERQPARIRLDLAETPPGSLGPAMLLGLLVTTALFLLAVFFPYLTCVGQGAVNISAPVLALPSLVAIWTAVNLQANLLVRLPWLSRISFASSGLSSVIAAVLLGLGGQQQLECGRASIYDRSWQGSLLFALFVINTCLQLACFSRLSRSIRLCSSFRDGANDDNIDRYAVKKND